MVGNNASTVPGLSPEDVLPAGMDSIDDLGPDTAVVPFESPAARQIVYIQLRPRMAVLARCVQALNDLLDEHPTVTVDLAGVGKTAKHLLLTLAVDAGPRNKIAKAPRDGESHEAAAAFGFAVALFDAMFDYLPQYAAEPSAEAREAAANLPTVIGRDRVASPMASAS